MTVLVLHRGSLAAAPYDRWARGHGVVLLASREQLDHLGEDLPEAGGGYVHVEAVEGYDLGGRLEVRALALAREHRVTHVIATQERDLERAARLREILGLPGQRSDSVAAFRDKARTKAILADAGIAVAPWAEVECAVDVIAFARDHGYPVVVKPRDGGGSVGLHVIRTEAELDAYLTTGLGRCDGHLPNLIVESYVEGPMCHVDGLVVGGEIVYAWPSRYLYALMTYKDDRGGRMDVTLEAGDPLAGRLVTFAEDVLDALPCPGDFAFHAEVFHGTDDRLVLCEIACRTGGAAQREIQRALFGVDPTEAWVRAQLGLPVPTGSGRLRPATMTGQLVLLRRPGLVRAVPGDPPFPWVESARVFVRPGEVMEAPTFSGDFLAAFVVSAPTREQSEVRMRRLQEWFLDGLSVEPALARTGGTRDAG